MREAGFGEQTRSLQIQDIQNEQVILGLHDAEHPVQGSVRLEREIHGDHPTTTLAISNQGGKDTVAWGSSILSNLSSADITITNSGREFD